MPKQTAFKTMGRTKVTPIGTRAPHKAAAVPAPRRVMDLVSDSEEDDGDVAHRHKMAKPSLVVAMPLANPPVVAAPVVVSPPMRDVDRHMLVRAQGKACAGACGAKRAVMTISTNLYCNCDLQLCIDCFAKMRYGPGVSCSVCNTDLDGHLLLADQAAVKEMVGMLNRRPLSMDAANMMPHFFEWARHGFVWHAGGKRLHMGSPGTDMAAAFGVADDQRLWVADHGQKMWVAVVPDRPLLLQHISPHCATDMSALQPQWN